jgi:hypothetical protein
MLREIEVRTMAIAADILALREQHFSSVAELQAALDQVYEALVDKISARVFLAGAAADLVLTNVAAHAAEALSDMTATRKTLRPSSSPRRNNRHPIQLPPSRQRILFAII